MKDTLRVDDQNDLPNEESEPPSEETEPPGTCSTVPRLFQFDRLARSVPAISATPSPSRRNGFPRSIDSHNRFAVSDRSEEFRARYFPSATEAEWCDWHWQLRNRIQSPAALSRIVRLSEDELSAVQRHSKNLPLAITPYYASLMDADDPQQPVRRAVVPVCAEYRRSDAESDDPLDEDRDSPVPGVVHRYPDRALFLVTDYCSTYCRYCTRSRMVGDRSTRRFDIRQWERALAYIENTPSIRDVLLSGGDPLTLSNDRLEWLLSRLRCIPHVEFIRIGTKAPVVLPQRITHALTRMLRRYHPLWISIHFTHPDELTPEVAQACTRLADAGIPLGSQTVLLADINDRVETMKRLVHGLLKIRVKPYYLYQCDPIPGSSHFRTSVEKGLEIIRGSSGAYHRLRGSQLRHRRTRRGRENPASARVCRRTRW